MYFKFTPKKFKMLSITADKGVVLDVLIIIVEIYKSSELTRIPKQTISVAGGESFSG